MGIEGVTSGQAPLTSLRGAGVGVDRRLVVRALSAIFFVGLTFAAVLLLVAGVHRNAQITRLQGAGIAQQVKVTGCLGLLGGSGTNAAGYQCRGSFDLGGQRYIVSIPGDSFHRPGATVEAIVDPSDPHLLALSAVLKKEHSSGLVFVLPAILFVLLFASAAVAISRRSRPAKGL